MSSFLGGLFSGVNSATDILSGAIDIIVVKQADGSFRCTPFHVRFGRLKVLRSREKVIRIMVNGKLTDICMKIGETGEAYFVQESDVPIPRELASSPILSPVTSPIEQTENPFKTINELKVDINKDESNIVQSVSVTEKQISEAPGDDGLLITKTFTTTLQRPQPSPHNTNSVNFEVKQEESIVQKELDEEGNKTFRPIHSESDGDIGQLELKSPTGPLNTDELTEVLDLPSTPVPQDAKNLQYDAVEKPEPKSGTSPSTWSWMWSWGSAPSQKLSSWFRGKEGNERPDGRQNDFIEQQFLETLQKQYNYDAMSNKYTDKNTPKKSFMKNAQASNSSQNINFMSVNDVMKKRRAALQRTTSNMSEDDNSDLLFTLSTNSDNEDLSDEEDCEELEDLPSPTNTGPPVNFIEKTQDDIGISGLTVSLPPDMKESASRPHSLPNTSSFENLFHSHKQHQKLKKQLSEYPSTYKKDEEKEVSDLLEEEEVEEEKTPTSSEPQLTRTGSSWKRWLWLERNNNTASPTTTTPTNLAPQAQQTSEEKQVYLKKTLRPTSDQLKALNLHHGRNEVKFLVTSRILGTQEVTGYIYMWNHDSKIVISDVDGTITKSDALGHILPIFGRDWSHIGIARLYTNIQKNGYEVMYLTARSIIQAGATKNYILSLKQESLSLPEGPVLMAPDRLFHCLAREVIMKKPEEFKIACLREIVALFPEGYNPFFAGFGNRMNDVVSYRAIDIPIHKIFTVDPTGKIQVYGVSHTGYLDVNELVHHIFPDLKALKKVATTPEKTVDTETKKKFNSWNYWKVPVMKLDDLEEEKKVDSSPVVSTPPVITVPSNI